MKYVIVVLFWILAVSAPAKTLSPLKLPQPWIGKGQSVGLSQLQKFVDISKDNPQALGIINAGIKQAHGSEINDLLPFITVCDNTLLGQSIGEGGMTNSHVSYYEEALMLPEQFENPSWVTTQLEELKEMVDQDSEITNTTIKKYFVRIDVVTRNKICIAKRDSVHDAFLAFIHELVHFSGPVPANNFENFLELFPDSDTFVKSDLLSSGGEIEAFTNQFQVQIWLDGGRSQLPQEVKEAFDNQGVLTNPKILYKYVAENLEYGSRIKDDYADTLIYFYNEALKLEDERDTQLAFYNVVRNPTPALIEVKKSVADDIARLQDLKQRYFERITRDKIDVVTE